MTYFITGTSRGIGQYLAKTYCEQGHKVFGCSRSEATIQHQNFSPLTGDITQESDVIRMMNQIKASGQGLDVVINNAGVASMNHVLLTPQSTVSNVFNTNFLGTFLVCREASKLLKNSKNPRIINFSTVAVALNLEGEAVYAASKAAVETLTQILAKELASFKITVNAIGPTPIRTELVKNVPEEKLQNLLSQQAIKRMGEFSDVKNVIDFYTQDTSDFITGQVIYLGGVTR